MGKIKGKIVLKLAPFFEDMRDKIKKEVIEEIKNNNES